jgi:hypothetical protein
MFRLGLLTAADIGALKRTCAGLNSLLSAEYDIMRHHAIGGLRHCLDSLNPAAALFALKRSGADPTIDEGRPLRVAIRTRHDGLLDWLAVGGFARRADFPDFYSDLDFCLRAGNDRAFLKLFEGAHRHVQARALEHLIGDGDGEEAQVPSPLVIALAVKLLQTHESSAGLMRELAWKFLSCFPPERALDAVPLESYFSGNGSNLLVRRCVEYAGKKGRDSTARRLLDILAKELSPKERTALAQALAGVGRLDLAGVAAPHPAVFDFVIAPSSPGEILDLVSSDSYPFWMTLGPVIRQHAPTEVLVERLSGADIFDVGRPGQDLYSHFVEVLPRSDAEARKALYALAEGVTAEAREDIDSAIEAIIRLRAQGTLRKVLEEATEGVVLGNGLFENADLDSHEFSARCIEFAHVIKYYSAIESIRKKRKATLISLPRFVSHKLGFFGAPEEVAEILAGVPACEFSLKDYRLGQESWRTMKAPESNIVAKLSFWDDRVFAARPTTNIGEIHAKAEAWAIETSNSRFNVTGVAMSPLKLRAFAMLIAICRALDEDHDELVVELAMDLEAGAYEYLASISVPPRFAPQLIAAGLDLSKLKAIRISTHSGGADTLDELEFCISEVWAGVAPR